MAHAHHFLERLDRVTRAQTEFALGLYRDDAAVRYVLEHVKLPPEATRVALSIEDPREGPFVLVTREGRFVTCLGKGMRHEHPVVPRAQIDALLAKVAEKRARREMAQRDLRPDEDEEDVTLRVSLRGSRLSREDFVAVSAFEPLLSMAWWEVMREVALDAGKSRLALVPMASRATSVDPKEAKALEGVHRMEWAVAHMAVLACAGERRELDAIVEAAQDYAFAPMFGCALQGGLPFLMRSAWAAARLGRGIIPRYKRALAEADNLFAALDAALGLGAIALRHSGTAAEIERILQSYPVPAGDRSTPEYLRQWAARTVAQQIEPAAVAQNEQAALAGARESCVRMGESLPEGHPLRFGTAADVPEDLARTTILWLDFDTYDPEQQKLAFAVLPIAARASAEDFFFPREVIRAWIGRWSPEETLLRIRRLPDAGGKPQPVRAAKTPGRNDPCTCGSGKKWKKCHGAK